MKFSLIALVSLISLSASADNLPMPTEATDALNMVAQCPSEFFEVSKLGFVSSTSRRVHNDQETYRIVISSGGYPPTFQIEKKAELIIKKLSISDITFPDAPAEVSYSCEVIH